MYRKLKLKQIGNYFFCYIALKWLNTSNNYYTACNLFLVYFCQPHMAANNEHSQIYLECDACVMAENKIIFKRNKMEAILR